MDRLEPTGELSREEFFDYLKLVALVQLKDSGGGCQANSRVADGSSSINLSSSKSRRDSDVSSSSSSSESDGEELHGGGRTNNDDSSSRQMEPVVANLAVRAPLPRVGGVEARLSAWKVTSEPEVEAYRELWKRAVFPAGSTAIKWAAAAPFFKSSSLPLPSIESIWEQSNRGEPRDALLEVEFVEACKMVALEQSSVYPPNPSAKEETTVAEEFGLTADTTSGLSASALAIIWDEFDASKRREDYLCVQTPLPRFEMASRYSGILRQSNSLSRLSRSKPPLSNR